MPQGKVRKGSERVSNIRRVVSLVVWHGNQKSGKTHSHTRLSVWKLYMLPRLSQGATVGGLEGSSGSHICAGISWQIVVGLNTNLYLLTTFHCQLTLIHYFFLHLSNNINILLHPPETIHASSLHSNPFRSYFLLISSAISLHEHQKEDTRLESKSHRTFLSLR